MTSVVHISEISNILKHVMPIHDLQTFLIGLYSLDNIKIIDVSKEQYLKAIGLIDEYGIDPNDCLALVLMEEYGIDEIYTFDKGSRK